MSVKCLMSSYVVPVYIACSGKMSINQLCFGCVAITYSGWGGYHLISRGGGGGGWDIGMDQNIFSI